MRRVATQRSSAATLRHAASRTRPRGRPRRSPVRAAGLRRSVATTGTRVEALIREALADHAIYVLEADLQARGLNRLIAGVQVVGYDVFVDLVAEHNVLPWL